MAVRSRRSFPGDLAISPTASSHVASPARRYEIADFHQIDPVACPCGWARRAFCDVADFPGTIHVTEISTEARTHYHRTLTETYYFLECEPGAQMQLDDEVIDVHAGLCVMIRPGVRHRAIGTMKVLIVVLPKFDPHDEWFD
jgi:mannose-6-phosphate isomerase-like protein (cupin superfamily)